MKFLLIFLSVSCLEERALYYIGAREQGFNRGTHIEALQRKCGLEKGQAYCSCYVWLKHKECGIADLPRVYNRAASWGRADRIVWQRGDPPDAIQEGFVVLFGETPDKAYHNGTVFKGVRTDGKGDYILVDNGNTSSFNIIEGEGVHLSKVYLRNICAIADWITPKGEEPVKFHYVEPRQNLYRISLKYETTVSELMRLNNLQSEVIYIGQKLRVE